jgi:hypothetical protein
MKIIARSMGDRRPDPDRFCRGRHGLVAVTYSGTKDIIAEANGQRWKLA